MNSRLTMGLAIVFLLGAIVAGYWGLVLSRQAPAVVATAPAPVVVAEQVAVSAEDAARVPVVVLLHDVPPFIPLTAADVALEKLRTAPAGSLTNLDQAVGRTPWRTLTAGTWLTDSSFDAGGSLARMIRPTERALAVAVDEVSSVGGQLSPGDYVDVLLFLRQDASNLQQSAQVVLPAIRLLGVGDQLGLTNDGKPATPALSAEQRLQQDQRRAGARTVVLAVPEQLMSRLLLATQVGSVRLAVRSADEQRLARYWAGETEVTDPIEVARQSLFQFTQLALAGPPRGPVFSGGASRARGTEVIRGNQYTQQTP